MRLERLKNLPEIHLIKATFLSKDIKIWRDFSENIRNKFKEPYPETGVQVEQFSIRTIGFELPRQFRDAISLGPFASRVYDTVNQRRRA